MKLLNTIAMGAFALAAVSVVSATTIKITGSSAYRKAIFSSAIGNGYNQAAFIGASIDKANQAVFRKVNGSGFDYIQCCFAGSVGGVKWVSTNDKVGTSPSSTKARSWIDPVEATLTYSAATDGASPDFVPTGGTVIAADNASTAATIFEGDGVGPGAPADYTMSDSQQLSTPYHGGVYNTLNDVVSGGVGVVPFVFAKGKAHGSLPAGSYNRFTNVSALAFQYIAANGFAPLALFTGNPADTGVEVVLTGRDNDSGTRLGTNFETGYGDVNTGMAQFQPFIGAIDGGSQAGTIDSFTQFASLTAGYASGGSVKQALQNPVTGTSPNYGYASYIILGYVGEGDSPTQGLTAPAAGAQELTYNGMPYSKTTTQLGQYTFWTIEHMYKRSAAPVPTAAQNTIANAIGNSLFTTYAQASKSGILLDAAFTPTRSSEGTVVSPNY